jgi:NTE family protein
MEKRHNHTMTDLDIKPSIAEGSTVTLDADDFIEKNDLVDKAGKSYLWTKISGPPITNLVDEKTKNPSFKVLYVENNNITADLVFSLKITLGNGKKSEHKAIVKVKRVHRVLILQGAVSLGAYEAGVYEALFYNLKEKDKVNGRKGRNLFDIIAGTSIGAMNASIILSNFKENQSFDGSVERLRKFWDSQMIPTFADIADLNPIYHAWWDYLHSSNKINKQSWNDVLTDYCSSLNPDSPFRRWCETCKDYFIDSWDIPGTGEAARRHYSTWQFPIFWPRGIYSVIPRWDGKFWDPLNFKFRTDNRHLPLFSLIDTLKKFTSFPIKTHEGEPRFLLVSIDVQSGDAVEFDSYGKVVKDENNKSTIPTTECKSEYGQYDINSKKYEHIISYPEGISVEHVMASSAFPLLFDYPGFEDNNSKEIPNKKRIFWDGGYLSNTPLREVIQAHRDYWLDSKNEVPDLEVYIADTWPATMKEEPVSVDNDFTENRKDDLIFGDKTEYDEKVANIVTDYIDLTNELIRFAKVNGLPQDGIDNILNKYAKKSKSRTGERRQYVDLMKGRFGLTKVLRIQLEDDGNTISTKYYDYSTKTISQLIENGKHDTLIKMKTEFIDNLLTELTNFDGIRDHISKYESIKQLLVSIRTELIAGQRMSPSQLDELINEIKTINGNGKISERANQMIGTIKHFQQSL